MYVPNEHDITQALDLARWRARDTNYASATEVLQTDIKTLQAMVNAHRMLLTSTPVWAQRELAIAKAALERLTKDTP